MKALGIGLIVFGILVIAFPELISILIGILLIVTGTNTLFFWYLASKKDDQRFRFGTFEIIRNRPNSKK